MKNILIFLLAFTFVTCKKNDATTSTSNDEALPVANFSTNKAEYDAGETMQLTSTSTNADNVRWTLPDGTTSRDASISYQLSPLLGDSKINVKLEAISKSGTKSDYIVKGIKVNAGKGTLTLYSSFYLQSNVSITIDGIKVADANLDYSKGAPTDCGQSGYSSYTVVAGSHVLYYSYVDSMGGFSGTKNFTMTTGGCVKLQL